MRFPRVIIIFLVILLLVSLSCKKSKVENTVILNNVDAKIIGIPTDYDEKYKPISWYYVFSINQEWLDSLSTPYDNQILAPDSIPNEFQILGLKVIISGKKYLDKNNYIVIERGGGFGYYFELTEIKKKN